MLIKYHKIHSQSLYKFVDIQEFWDCHIVCVCVTRQIWKQALLPATLKFKQYRIY